MSNIPDGVDFCLLSEPRATAQGRELHAIGSQCAVSIRLESHKEFFLVPRIWVRCGKDKPSGLIGKMMQLQVQC